MQYLSPGTFTGETISGPLDKKAIQLRRKKLFAELELSGETTIDLQGKPFTKNDIIKYFDDLLKEDALIYHSVEGCEVESFFSNSKTRLAIFIQRCWGMIGYLITI